MEKKINLLISELNKVIIGNEDNILLAQDICTKHRLKKFGGHGFDHLLKRIVPWMKSRNIDKENIDKMMIKNPQTMLTIK